MSYKGGRVRVYLLAIILLELSCQALQQDADLNEVIKGDCPPALGVVLPHQHLNESRGHIVPEPGESELQLIEINGQRAVCHTQRRQRRRRKKNY